jgi:hypothetical protein
MKKGDKIIAFEFDDFEGYYCSEEMKSLIGQEGTIVRISETYIDVNFKEYGTFGYPKEMAENYLVKKTKDLFPIY